MLGTLGCMTFYPQICMCMSAVWAWNDLSSTGYVNLELPREGSFTGPVNVRVNTVFTPSQWERRPKVAVLHGEQMCRSICPPLSAGVVMCVPLGTFLCQVHSSITRWLKSYARAERSPIHETGFRGHAHTHTHTSSLFLFIFCSTSSIACRLISAWHASDLHDPALLCV